jgi:triacylglycerol esterase/lipase EstA (alpha/beta hydrolase family)
LIYTIDDEIARLDSIKTLLTNMDNAIEGNSVNALQYLLIRIQEYQNYLNTNVNTIMNNSTSSLTKLDQVVSGFSNVDIANFPANFPDVDVKNLITALNSKIDSLNGKIDAITGGTTPAVTTLLGSKVAEQLTQTNAVSGVLTFSDTINWIGIYNTDTVNDGVFTVNGIGITVPKSATFQDGIGGTIGKTVSVTGSTSYIVTRYV